MGRSSKTSFLAILSAPDLLFYYHVLFFSPDLNRTPSLPLLVVDAFPSTVQNTLQHRRNILDTSAQWKRLQREAFHAYFYVITIGCIMQQD